MKHSSFTIAFPFRTDSNGQLAISHGIDSIRESIIQIISTVPGERALRPSFGCRANELVFAPNNPATASLATHYIREAILTDEPRVSSVRVTAEPDGNETLAINVWFTVRDSACESNISINLPNPVNGAGRGSMQ